MQYSWLSTATMVARTCLNVTLYVQCLSLFYILLLCVNEVALWNRFLLEKLIVPQLIKEFPEFNGTRKSVVLCARTFLYPEILVNRTRKLRTLFRLINLQKIVFFSDLNVYSRLAFLYTKCHCDIGPISTPLPYRTNIVSEDTITGWNI